MRGPTLKAGVSEIELAFLGKTTTNVQGKDDPADRLPLNNARLVTAGDSLPP